MALKSQKKYKINDRNVIMKMFKVKNKETIAEPSFFGDSR